MVRMDEDIRAILVNYLYNSSSTLSRQRNCGAKYAAIHSRRVALASASFLLQDLRIRRGTLSIFPRGAVAVPQAVCAHCRSRDPSSNQWEATAPCHCWRYCREDFNVEHYARSEALPGTNFTCTLQPLWWNKRRREWTWRPEREGCCPERCSRTQGRGSASSRDWSCAGLSRDGSRRRIFRRYEQRSVSCVHEGRSWRGRPWT